MIPTISWGSCVKEGVATLACIPIVVQNIINFLVVFAAVACVFLIIWGGIKLIMSEGDPEKTGQARKLIIYALAGFFFILISFVLLNSIAQYTGVRQLSPR